MTIKIRRPYDGERVRVTAPEDPVSMTKQSHKEECDINNIVDSFQSTGVVTHLNRHQPQYGAIDGTDFKTAMDIVTGAQSMFNELPSGVRNRFKNDPAAFLDFVSDPENVAELQTLGLGRKDPSSLGQKSAEGATIPEGDVSEPASEDSQATA